MILADITPVEWPALLAVLAAIVLPILGVGIKLMITIGKLEVHMKNVNNSCHEMSADHKHLWEKYGETVGKMTTHDVLLARLCDSAGISKD